MVLHFGYIKLLIIDTHAILSMVCIDALRHHIAAFSGHSIVFWRNSLKVDFTIYLRSLHAQQSAA
jgi:hypothetical protein